MAAKTENAITKRIDPTLTASMFGRHSLLPSQFARYLNGEADLVTVLAIESAGIDAILDGIDSLQTQENGRVVGLLSKIAGFDRDYFLGLSLGWDGDKIGKAPSKIMRLGHKDGVAAWNQIAGKSQAGLSGTSNGPSAK